jgi:sec-independent protein translocase protein TatA
MELVIVLVVALLILGPKRLPEAGRSLGQGIRGFKDSITGNDDAPALADVPADAVSAPRLHAGQPEPDAR